MTNSRVEKWRRWCEGQIRNEVLTLHLHRYTFRELGRIAEANGKLPESYFWDYVGDTYAMTQAIAIRRQAETKQGVCALGRLLCEMERDASLLTRARFFALWDADDQPQADREFTQHFAGAMGEHLDPEIPRNDLKDLTAVSASVKKYVDQHLAHSDAGARAGPPTFHGLDSAIDLIGHLFKKYVYALTAATWATLEPVIQHDWLAVFREPWIR